MDYHVIESVLTADECTALIKQAEEVGLKDSPVFNQQTKKYSMDKSKRSSTFAPVSSDLMKEKIIGRIREKCTDIDKRLEIVTDSRVIKYTDGGYFKAHRDIIFTEGEYVGKYNMIVYLSDNYEDGETCFIDSDQQMYFPVKGKVGDVLIFDPRLLHMGSEVNNGVKYILIVQLFIKKPIQ